MVKMKVYRYPDSPLTGAKPIGEREVKTPTKKQIDDLKKIYNVAGAKYPIPKVSKPTATLKVKGRKSSMR